jgi:hypothetical protein
VQRPEPAPIVARTIVRVVVSAVEAQQIELLPRRAAAPERKPQRPRRDRPAQAPAAPSVPIPSLPTLTSAGAAHGTGGASVGLGIVVAAAAAATLDLLRRVVPVPARFRRQGGGDRPERPG